MHGASPDSLQSMPASTIGPTQQSYCPKPGTRVLHPVPPQVPHSSLQQTPAASTPGMPLLHVSPTSKMICSGSAEGSGYRFMFETIDIVTQHSCWNSHIKPVTIGGAAQVLTWPPLNRIAFQAFRGTIDMKRGTRYVLPSLLVEALRSESREELISAAHRQETLE